jgi:hypothetical protein
MLLNLLQVLINGTETNVPKASLHKQEEAEDILQKLNEIIARNFYVISLAIIVLCFLLFVFCCFAIVGMSGTESGLTYNQLQRII